MVDSLPHLHSPLLVEHQLSLHTPSSGDNPSARLRLLVPSRSHAAVCLACARMYYSLSSSGSICRVCFPPGSSYSCWQRPPRLYIPPPFPCGLCYSGLHSIPHGSHHPPRPQTQCSSEDISHRPLRRNLRPQTRCSGEDISHQNV
jgi:hypothetical protein